MNLPLFVDIALGLVFIFLTLSLLASELQELISTLLQWRAEHLKRSIELLLSGDKGDQLPAIAYADRLYEHPLIATLNQEAKGPLARLVRTVSQVVGQTYRTLTRTRNVFGRFRSGPSYIPAPFFAAALLSDLNLDAVGFNQSREQLMAYRSALLRLMGDFLQALRRCTGDRSLLVLEFDELSDRLQAISDELSQRRLSYTDALHQTRHTLTTFVSAVESVLAENEACQDTLQRQVPFLKQAIDHVRAEPTLSEVIEQALNVLDHHQHYVPDQLKHTLRSLAREVQTQAESLTDGVARMEKAVGNWFDRAMDRASGVYSRNAKGVALLLGLLIAISTNTDTFYVVHRLSRDSLLRASLFQAVTQVQSRVDTATPLSIPEPGASEPGAATSEAPTSDPTTTTSSSPEALRLNTIRQAVNENLDELPLPFGWNDTIVREQQRQAAVWPIPLLRRLLGWLITAIAVSMGASFWYSILSKIVKVRNTGPTDASSRSSDSASAD